MTNTVSASPTNSSTETKPEAAKVAPGANPAPVETDKQPADQTPLKS